MCFIVSKIMRSIVLRKMNIQLIEENHHHEIFVNDEKENLENDCDVGTQKERTWFSTMSEYHDSVKDKILKYKEKCEGWLLSWGTYL